VGREEWLHRRAQEAARGFELHTGKCYRSPETPGRKKT
jgi:hypothetical protein